MSIEIVINATNEETRVAILENRTVTEFYIDRKKDRGIVGNVYKGKVVKVLPGMQAAFVDIGVEKAAFLYVSDVSSGVEDYEKYFLEERNKEGEETNGEEEVILPFSEEESADLQEEPENILEEVPSEVPPLDDPTPAETDFLTPRAFDETSFLAPAIRDEPLNQTVPNETNLTEAAPVSEVAQAPVPQEVVIDPSSGEAKKETPVSTTNKVQSRPKHRSSRHLKNRPKSRRSPRSIEDLLKEGQEILVQVSKDAMGTKGPRVTTYVSLPGRYLVYMPTVNHIGISRRIGSGEERGRLKEMLYRLRKPGTGYIIRTVSEGTTEEEFKSDMEFLELLWQSMLKKKEKMSAPALLHIDLDLIFRTVRDLFTKKVDRLVIDSRAEYERIKDYAKMYLQELASRVELYTKEEPIFDAYEIETEISKALARKVWLKSGGYLVFDRTEALTVIDVNTGRYVGKRDLEETILKTNLEALKEIAYQLKLRNIGGIVTIDFIDMEKEKNREKVFQSLQEAMSKDKARINILKISELGLIELSRERTRDDVQRILCEPCHYCEGRGHIRSASTICYEIFREIKRIGNSPREKKVIVTAHPSVANLMYDEERQGVEDLEKAFKKRIIIKPDHNMHLEHYNVTMV
ncbi:MAG: Rne/Rng family ribonuclease [Nitrospirae bacterium]|nr:Rne/Rng family ribonuclease [Nitrospirota bacterium]MBI3353007.1 Rne/Rng family ribonuclease [Nitrospirota bacterium]